MADPYEDEKGQPSQGDAGKYFPDADDTSTGKHLTFLVPDFNNAEAATGGDGSTPLNSYLRLGCAHSQAGNTTRTDLGEDLAAKVKGFTDDTRNRGTEQNPAPGVPVAPAGYDPPPGSPLDYRLNESKRLHNKGGWRDHSDGNRITTTRGDKIEVIRGNYKLLVLGRQDGMDNPDGTAHAAGFDISGGNIDVDSNDVAALGDIGYPGSSATNTAGDQAGFSMSWEWVQDTGPTASGTPGDNQFRWHVTNIQGAESPTVANPAILSKTWAYTIDTFVGSAAAPVHEMTSTTYVDDQAVDTYVTNSQVTYTTAGNEVRVNVDAPSYTQEIDGTHITNRNVATSTVSAINISPEILYLDLGASRTEIDMAALIMEVKVALAVLEIKTLAHVDVHLGDHADFHVGMHADVCVGASTQVVLGTSNTAVVGVENKVNLTRNEIAGTVAATAGMFTFL